MGFGSNEVSTKLEYRKEDCMAAAKAAIAGLKKFSIKSESSDLGLIQVSVAPGLTSTTWGDTLTLSFVSDTTGTVMTVNSSSKSFSVAAGGQQARNISAFMDAFTLHISGYEKITAAEPSSATSNYADELIKLKELLDMGVITQEDFDAKKKQILGL